MKHGFKNRITQSITTIHTLFALQRIMTFFETLVWIYGSSMERAVMILSRSEYETILCNLSVFPSDNINYI